MDEMNEWDDRRSAGTAPGPAWVSAADAADKSGTTPSRVREWAREGVIASQSTHGPLGEQILVRLEEVVERARGESGPRDEPADQARVYNHVATAELSPIFKTIPELVVQLTSATDRAARAETKVEFLTRQIGELKRKLVDASTEGAEATTIDEDEGLSGGLLEADDAIEEEPPPTDSELDSIFDEPSDGTDAALAANPSTKGSGAESQDSLKAIWAEDLQSGADGETRGGERVRRLPDPPRRRWWSRRR